MNEPPLFDFLCDLHIHTCLSPCGSLSASPRAQVLAAATRGLDVIAVADHNAAANVAAAQKMAKQTGTVVLAGMEICSAEEVHAVALLPDLSTAMDLQQAVWEHLPGENNPEIFGMQVIADHEDNVDGFCDRLLIGATTWSLTRVAAEVHNRGGLLIAAHIDREGYGVIAQLGFVPENVFDALEVGAMGDPDEYRAQAERLHLPLLRSSDAHFPDDVGRVVSVLRMAHRTFAELTMALRGENGRRVISERE